MFIRLFLAIAIVLSVFACEMNPSQKKVDISTTEKQIVLQPFTDFSPTHAGYIEQKLKKIYPVVKLNKSIDFPLSTLNESKTRYRADSVIRFLKKQVVENTIIIGLTNKDISVTNGKYKDWGVMGYSYCPGESAIASSFRLVKKQQSEQLFKVVIHELGHAHGLPHCKSKNCYMQDAEGKNKTNLQTKFCFKCKGFLNKAGWKLK